MAVFVPPEGVEARDRVASRVEWMAERVAAAGRRLPTDDARAMRLQVAAIHAEHLARLIRFHGRPFDRLAVPAERPMAVPAVRPAVHSLAGSPADACAALGDRGTGAF